MIEFVNELIETFFKIIDMKSIILSIAVFLSPAIFHFITPSVALIISLSIFLFKSISGLRKIYFPKLCLDTEIVYNTSSKDYSCLLNIENFSEITYSDIRVSIEDVIPINHLYQIREFDDKSKKLYEALPKYINISNIDIHPDEIKKILLFRFDNDNISFDFLNDKKINTKFTLDKDFYRVELKIYIKNIKSITYNVIINERILF